MIELAALVLAGGRATRMGGGDKALLPLGEATILHMLLARLRPQAAALALSANGDAARFAPFGLPVLPDPAWAQGPLAGLAAGLAWAEAAGATALLTVPGDTPFIPPDLAASLSPAPAWAESSGYVHPLVALWPVTAGARLKAWLHNGGSLRVRDFGHAIGMRGVPFPGQPDPFFNINTAAELAQAQARAAAAAETPLGKMTAQAHLGH